jgi:hypothetical protein
MRAATLELEVQHRLMIIMKCFLLSAIFLLLSCNSNIGKSDSQIKNEIQTQLNKCAEAVEMKDINLYMELIPKDFIIYDENGEVISREKQREYTLRDWNVIDKTISNNFIADSLEVFGDSAIVYTSQRWKRLCFKKMERPKTQS